MDTSGHSSEGKRVVLTTFGSLGELHPVLAVALGLKARGHHAVVATSEAYRPKVESLGLGFATLRPDLPDWTDDPGSMARIMDLRRGPERIIREMMMPVLCQSYDDTLAAAEGADLLLSHPLTFATRLVAEKVGLPWASTALSPLSFFSGHDPPVLAPAQVLSKLRFLGPAFNRPLFRFLKRTVRSWSLPWHRLRAEVGLPMTGDDPLMEGQHSPALVLALFSPMLAAGQPDWPRQTVTTGFPFLDRDGDVGLPTELSEFLDDGPPPIVFTLGSAAVRDAGRFYEHSLRAAGMLGRRAVLLIGDDPRNRPSSLPDGIAAFKYAPFSALFPRAEAIVHQGGVGTTGQALRSGRPMLVMPYAFDQPDNADRVARLGVGRTIPRRRYTAERAAVELRKLLDDPSYALRAEEVGRLVREEDGVGSACDALEALLRSPGHVGAAGG